MGKVYIVHCVDTEGPLDESLEATFCRIKEITGIELFPSVENLRKIQNKELLLDGYEDLLFSAFSKRIMAYNKDWSSLDCMLKNITSEQFRNNYSDKQGNGWKYTWFIMDHIDYNDNPRNKCTGYNAIWDHYHEFYRLNRINNDDFQWHVHPMNIYKSGCHCGVSYWNSPNVLQSLCHRLIDRGFFPSGFRAGYHTERPDSHWLLEQYIPYDFSNQAVEGHLIDKQLDLSEGRFGDWRRAKNDWDFYHPSHDDYQSEGQCHRYIFRCLNVGTRIRLINQYEVDKAFERANRGIDTVLAFCDHDFREMKYDVEEVFNYIRNSSERFPEVEWINSTAVEAAKAVISESVEEISMNVNIIHQNDGRTKLEVSTNIDSFGAQPFFAIKLKGDRYIAEQLDVQEPNREWSYIFDEESILAKDVEYIGLATNSRKGSGVLKVFSINGNFIFGNKW